MPRYIFREGVNVSEDGNDIIITTPYATRSNPNRQTLTLKDVKAPLKKFLKELSQEGIVSSQDSADPEKIASAAAELESNLKLELLYKNGLLIQEINGCNGIAMRTRSQTGKRKECPPANGTMEFTYQERL